MIGCLAGRKRGAELPAMPQMIELSPDQVLEATDNLEVEATGEPPGALRDQMFHCVYLLRRQAAMPKKAGIEKVPAMLVEEDPINKRSMN